MQKNENIESKVSIEKSIANWRKSMVRIGFTVTFVMMLPVPLILGDPSGWILVASWPLLLPLLFGNKKNRWLALILIIFFGGIGWYGLKRVEEVKRKRNLSIKKIIEQQNLKEER